MVTRERNGRLSRRLTCAVIFASCVFLFFILLGAPLSLPPNARSDNLQVEERLAPEEWVDRLAKDGAGVVRVAVAPDSAPTYEITCKHQGPLSEGGRETVERFVDIKLRDLSEAIQSGEAKVDTPSNLNADTELASFARQLRRVVRHQEYLIVRQQLLAGTYLTLANGEDWPPTSSDRSDFAFGPVGLAKGGFGHVLFLVDRNKRPATRQLYEAIKETLVADRQERIQAFNSRPLEERASWVARYRSLTNKARADFTSMIPVEVDSYLLMSREVKYLKVAVNELSCLMVPQ